MRSEKEIKEKELDWVKHPVQVNYESTDANCVEINGKKFVSIDWVLEGENQTRIYIVEHFVDWEAGSILGVFSSKAKAIKLVEQKKQEEANRYKETYARLDRKDRERMKDFYKAEWEELPTGWKINGEGWTWTELEIDKVKK